MQKLF